MRPFSAPVASFPLRPFCAPVSSGYPLAKRRSCAYVATGSRRLAIATDAARESSMMETCWVSCIFSLEFAHFIGWPHCEPNRCFYLAKGILTGNVTSRIVNFLREGSGFNLAAIHDFVRDGLRAGGREKPHQCTCPAYFDPNIPTSVDKSPSSPGLLQCPTRGSAGHESKSRPPRHPRTPPRNQISYP